MSGINSTATSIVPSTDQGASSLEDTFVRVTQQPDFTPVAREIIDTIRAS